MTVEPRFLFGLVFRARDFRLSKIQMFESVLMVKMVLGWNVLVGHNFGLQVPYDSISFSGFLQYCVVIAWFLRLRAFS